MKTTITLVSLVAVTVGVFAYTRPHKAMPSDLRDAVADNGKFDTSIPVFDKNSGNIPEPKAKAVDWESEWGSNMADANNANLLRGVPGANAFEKIKTLFDISIQATKEDLSGWHSGRMVRDNLPDQVYGAILLGGEKEDGAGELTFRVMTHPSDTPGYFDDLDAGKSEYLHLKWTNVEGRRIYFPSATSKPKVQSFHKVRGCVIEAYGRENSAPYSYAYYCKAVKPDSATCPTSTLARSRKEVRDLIERDPFCEGVAVSIIDGKKGNPYVNVILKGENTSGCAEIMKDRAGRIGMAIYSSDVLDVTPPTAYLRFQNAR